MNDRFLRHIADEIGEIVAHGGRGTVAGLLDHLRTRFGAVSEDEVAVALELVRPEIREAFR